MSDDGYALEVGTTIKIIRGSPAVPVEVGNTVELNEIDGITKVISHTPLTFRDAVVDAAPDSGRPGSIAAASTHQTP